MNRLYLPLVTALTLLGLSGGGLMAQTTSPQSGTLATNRRQELYDQYYGIKRKSTPHKPANPIPAKPTPPPPPVMAAKVPEPVPAPPVMSAKAPEPMAAPPVNDVDMATAPERQTISGSIQIGVRGGLIYPIYLDRRNSVDPGTDFIGGLVLVAGRGRVQFQPEINYARSVVRIDVLNNSTVRTANDQVIVPLLLKFTSGHRDATHLFVNVGPYAAYVTSSSLNGLKVPLIANQGRLSAGAAAGLGAAFRLAPGHVSVELRGRYELTRHNESSGSTALIGTTPRTLFTEATLSYVFPLGRR